MLTTNVLLRMMWLGKSVRGGVVPSGSGFVAELNGREYLVTARHVATACQYNPCLRLSNQWIVDRWPDPLVDDESSDITVFPFEGMARLHAFDVRYGIGGTILGQIGYALGFPSVGNRTDHVAEFEGRPIAIPTMLAINMTPGTDVVYCASYINAGYSGGVVVYPVQNTDNEWGIAGTITHFPTVKRPVKIARFKTMLHVEQHMGLLRFTPWPVIERLIEGTE